MNSVNPELKAQEVAKTRAIKEKWKGYVEYIHLINQARGPYWENIGPRS